MKRLVNAQIGVRPAGNKPFLRFRKRQAERGGKHAGVRFSYLACHQRTVGHQPHPSRQDCIAAITASPPGGTIRKPGRLVLEWREDEQFAGELLLQLVQSV